MNTEQVIEFTTTLSHGNHSTAAAFNVLLEELIPLGLNVQQPVNISLSSNLNSVGIESEIVERTNGSSLRVFSSVFTTDSEIKLTYITQVNNYFPKNQNVTAPVMVNYSSIKQEGIGKSVSVYVLFVFIYSIYTVTVLLCFGSTAM